MKIGIIGAGRIGLIHADSISKYVPQAQIAAIADINMNDTIKNRLLEFGVMTVYDDYRKILDDREIGAVLICTSTDMHAHLSIEAIAAGKHVFCEKPIALSIKETKEVMNALEGIKLKYQLGFNQRSDKSFMEIQKIIKSGQIGKPHYAKLTSRDPAPPPVSYIEKSGGIFLDMMIHDFDLARFYMDCDPTEIYATGACLADQAIGKTGDIDTAAVTLKMENGAFVQIDNSRICSYGYDKRSEVFCEYGMVHAENITPITTVVSTKYGVTGPRPEGFFLERFRISYASEIISFINSIENDLPVVSGIWDSYINTIVGFAAKKSFHERRAIKISEVETH